MKAQPLQLVNGEYIPCAPKLATYLKIHIPGPLTSRIIPISITGVCKNVPNWTWNCNVDSPTIRPSVLTRSYKGEDVNYLCHSYITDGVVTFLSDSTHDLAGTSCDLLDIVD